VPDDRRRWLAELSCGHHLAGPSDHFRPLPDELEPGRASPWPHPSYATAPKPPPAPLEAEGVTLCMLDEPPESALCRVCRDVSGVVDSVTSDPLRGSDGSTR
jgi:hypothetical protein